MARENERTAGIELGGVRYDGLDPDMAKAISDEFKALKKDAAEARADAATYKAQLDACKKDLDTKTGEVEGIKTKIADLQEKLKEKEAAPAPVEEETEDEGEDEPVVDPKADPKIAEDKKKDRARKDAAFRARFDERIRLLAMAGKVGVQKADSMSNRDIKRAIIGARRPDLKLDGKNADFVNGIILGMVGDVVTDKDLAATARTLAGLNADGKGSPRIPVSNEDALTSARAEYIKNLKGE